MNRRRFLASVASAGALGALGSRRLRAQAPSDALSDDEILRRIDLHRPSRLAKLPSGLRDRVGATHTSGNYRLTDKPFLTEGAEKLIELGTRVAKFWFIPGSIARSYPYGHRWPECRTLADLVRSEEFQRVFTLPFTTVFLEAHDSAGHGWPGTDGPESYYTAIEEEMHDAAAALIRTYRDRPVTVVLQHWEGDWMLRGRAGETWETVPGDAKLRCARMTRWLAARQKGVAKARAAAPAGTACRILHAAEVNRVLDGAKGVPTVTRDVLPQVELDLVSYSCYDAMNEPVRLWRALEEIRAYCRTGPVLGPRAVCVGEFGIPENERPQGIAEFWDAAFGVFFALEIPWVVQWELYCNELRDAVKPPERPVKDPALVRGFWLVRPDGSLSETGRIFEKLWS